MSSEYSLYYHTFIAGRGEFVRLLFAEAGVKYEQPEGNMHELNASGKLGTYPNFAPPVLMKGDFNISQTPVICRYLGKQFGLWPESEEDQWHAEAVNTTIHDFIAEGRLVFHGKAFIASYYEQKEETQPYIDWFKANRFAKWLAYFEKCLAANNGGHGFVVGNRITYVDLALLHVLRAAASQFPDEWEKLDTIPLLKAFKDRVSARPNLAAYFSSPLCKPFEGNSMM